MITRRRKTLMLQGMSDNVSTGLVAFSKANQSLFIRNREQSNSIVLLCASTTCACVRLASCRPLGSARTELPGAVLEDRPYGQGQRLYWGWLDSCKHISPERSMWGSRAVRVLLLGSMETGSVAPQLPNQRQVDLMQNQQIWDRELRGSLPHTLIMFSCSGHSGRVVPKAQVLGNCNSILRKLKTTPPVKEVLLDLQIAGSWESYKMGNCYKMQVFENLYRFILFHEHRLLKSSQQATATAGLHACSSSFIIALLIPDLQALLVFEALNPRCSGWINGSCLPSLSSMCGTGSAHSCWGLALGAALPLHPPPICSRWAAAAVYFYLPYK